jgi:hypothetical protein
VNCSLHLQTVAIANLLLGVLSVQKVVDDVDGRILATDDGCGFFEFEIAVECARLPQWWRVGLGFHCHIVGPHKSRQISQLRFDLT